MIGPGYRPLLSLLACCTSASFAAYAPAARADVFEIGKEGQWQQISKSPYGAPDISVGDNDSGTATGSLPPVRLTAITSVGQQVESQQPAIIGSGPASGRYAPLINAAANQYGISPALVDAVMWQESRYNHKAVSSAGAIGLMQLMPDTARYLGVNPHDPWQNVFGGAAYLRKQLDRFGNNVPLALAAYNAGPEAVAKYGGIPPYAETRGYVRTITHRLMTQGQ